MMSIASRTPLSAGIELLLSSMALIHTKLCSRLGSDKVAKLVVHAYRHFGSKEEDQEDHLGDLISHLLIGKVN